MGSRTTAVAAAGAFSESIWRRGAARFRRMAALWRRLWRIYLRPAVVLLHLWMAALGSLVGPLGLGGPVVLDPWLQGAWRRLAASASYHRGGAGDRPGVDSGLDLHRPVRPMVEVERWPAHPLHRQRGSALLSSMVRPRVAQVGLFPAIFGANGGAGAKALLEADVGDACGRRFLLGGIVMALPCYPTTSAGGNP
jgi:hypothetical protein